MRCERPADGWCAVPSGPVDRIQSGAAAATACARRRRVGVRGVGMQAAVRGDVRR